MVFVIVFCLNVGFYLFGVLKLCMDVKVLFGIVYIMVFVFYNSFFCYFFLYFVLCLFCMFFFNYLFIVFIGKDDMV